MCGEDGLLLSLPTQLLVVLPNAVSLYACQIHDHDSCSHLDMYIFTIGAFLLNEGVVGFSV
jgi:hypothetical protein